MAQKKTGNYFSCVKLIPVDGIDCLLVSALLAISRHRELLQHRIAQ